jgi:AraC family transcriptional activator of tynA and feaB
LRTLFSTTDVHPRDRFDYWHSVACKSLVDHDSVPECRQSFVAELRSGAIADASLVLFENSPMTIAHTAAQAAAPASGEMLFICRQARGCLTLEQETREALLEPGDLTLLDPRLPYRGRFEPGSRLLVLEVPRPRLEARLGALRELTACVIKPATGNSRLISGLVAMLPEEAGDLSRPAQEIVIGQVLDLFALCLAETGRSRRPGLSSARSLVMMNVRAAIEARLADPALDAETVAGAAGVSLRYANAVLAADGTSIRRLIQARRLARCRGALADPLQAHRTVKEIAYGWGFSDMTHFGRKFKATYGLLPSEYRRCTRATGADSGTIAARGGAG